MGKVLIEEENLTNIANAIREKNGETTTYKPGDMASAIQNISSGGATPKIGFVATEWYSVGNGQFDGAPTKGIWYGKSVPEAGFYTPAGPTYMYYTPFGLLEEITFADNLESIRDQAFYQCRGLKQIELPASFRYIMPKAFYGCSHLTEVTFKGSNVTSIASDVFSSCSKLTTINVPWAEGEVANAPWGATNATINYNYVGGES